MINNTCLCVAGSEAWDSDIVGMSWISYLTSHAIQYVMFVTVDTRSGLQAPLWFGAHFIELTSVFIRSRGWTWYVFLDSTSFVNVRSVVIIFILAPQCPCYELEREPRLIHN